MLKTLSALLLSVALAGPAVACDMHDKSDKADAGKPELKAEAAPAKSIKTSKAVKAKGKTVAQAKASDKKI